MDANRSNDWRSVKLAQMIQTAIQGLPDRKKKNEIIDFIMEYCDLPITRDQIAYILRSSSPAVDPMRKDYLDVLARLVSEAKTHGDPQLVKNIYLSIPFYPDGQENQPIREFYKGGIQYFLSLGLYQIVGEL